MSRFEVPWWLIEDVRSIYTNPSDIQLRGQSDLAFGKQTGRNDIVAGENLDQRYDIQRSYRYLTSKPKGICEGVSFNNMRGRDGKDFRGRKTKKGRKDSNIYDGSGLFSQEKKHPQAIPKKASASSTHLLIQRKTTKPFSKKQKKTAVVDYPRFYERDMKAL